MQVVKVIPETFEFVKTDKEEWPTYRRYQDGRWENLVGESWELVYYTEQLEAAYQAFRAECEWLCTHCNMLLSDSFGPFWRWNGHIWEHKCPGSDSQAGHFPAVLVCELSEDKE